MKTLTVATRLGLGFGGSIAMLILIALIGIRSLASLEEATSLIAKDRWVKAKMVGDIVQHTDQIALALRDMMLAENGDEQARDRGLILEHRKAIGQLIETLRPLVTLPKGKEILGQVMTQRERYVAGQEKLIALIESGASEPARHYLNHELKPILVDYQGALAAFREFQSDLVTQASQSAEKTYEHARNLTIAIVMIAAAIGTLVSAWIVRSVTRPLGGEPEAAKLVVERIAQGDLTSDIRIKPGDETSLMAATRRMQASLHRMMLELKGNAEKVAASAEELATGATQVAAATAEQSSAAASMAAAVEQMTVSINHVSESAREAHGVTADAGQLSQTGSNVIEAMVAEMHRLSQVVGDAAQDIRAMGDKSQEISTIVQVIREVAEQTNLLALNAAIEAARAGEQGRGFAVVADEVRKLAERTSGATTEIGAMIDSVQNCAQTAVKTMHGAVSRVDQGLEMAAKANSAILGISDGAQRVVSAVSEISHAIREQSAASNEIAANVEKIAQMSEENSAATLGTSDTAKQLERLALETRQTVGRFRI